MLRMRFLSKMRSLLRNLIFRSHLDGDLDSEVRAHLVLLKEELVRKGISPDEAERAARIELGGIEQVKEQVREQRLGTWLSSVFADCRFALRVLRKSPGFTFVATLTLALGIGANTAIFSIIDTTLLRPLPYSNPSNLVWAGERFPLAHGASAVISPDFIAWKDHNQTLNRIEAFALGSGVNLVGSGEPMRLDVTDVTPGLFSLLGVTPVAGRTFLPSEGQEGKNQVALLSESLWRSHFAADPKISGKTIRLDDNLFTVVGVMPATLRYPAGDIWTPLALNSDVFSPQSPRWRGLTAIARLKRGVDASQAQSDLQLVTLRMNSQYPPQAADFRKNVRVEVLPLHSLLVQNVRSLLLILLGVVAFILLIACANVANLLLSHGVIRAREMAVRAALGASRSRLIRQMFTEAFLLAVAGAALGLLIGLCATKILRQLVPSDLPSDVHLDPRILLFCVAVTVLSILAFGLLPAEIASRPYVHEALKAGSSRQSSTPGTHRLRALLSAGEIALSLILLVGAGLLARSFLLLSEVDLGFEPHGLLTVSVQRPVTADPHSQQFTSFFQAALQQMRNLPRVGDAALTTHLPLRIPNAAGSMITTQGMQPLRLPSPISFASVSPDYFRTMSIRLLKGRVFLDADTADAPHVVVINNSLEQIVFGKRNPLGQHVSFGPPPESWLEIVGVVSDTVGSGLDQVPMPEAFMPYLQDPSFAMTFVLRTPDHPEALASSVRAAVETVDKNQPLSEMSTMDDTIAKSIAPQRFKMLLLGLFALLALILATVGIYGVMSYGVEQRTHELGVRIALGASKAEILGLIVGQGLKLTLAGVTIGIIGAFALTHFVANMLYGVSERDPLTFIAVALLLSLVALTACFIPAWHATRVDPVVALRHE
jgi:predicted permease